jgi:hypothetical protein
MKLLVPILSDVAPDHPPPDYLGKKFEPAPKASANPETRPKHIWKEFNFVKWLCTVEWSTRRQKNTPVVPKELQLAEESRGMREKERG